MEDAAHDKLDAGCCEVAILNDHWHKKITHIFWKRGNNLTVVLILQIRILVAVDVQIFSNNVSIGRCQGIDCWTGKSLIMILVLIKVGKQLFL